MNKAMNRTIKANNKKTDEYTFEEYLREFVPSIANKFLKPPESRGEQLERDFRRILSSKTR